MSNWDVATYSHRQIAHLEGIAFFDMDQKNETLCPLSESTFNKDATYSWENLHNLSSAFRVRQLSSNEPERDQICMKGGKNLEEQARARG